MKVTWSKVKNKYAIEKSELLFKAKATIGSLFTTELAKRAKMPKYGYIFHPVSIMIIFAIVIISQLVMTPGEVWVIVPLLIACALVCIPSYFVFRLAKEASEQQFENPELIRAYSALLDKITEAYTLINLINDTWAIRDNIEKYGVSVFSATLLEDQEVGSITFKCAATPGSKKTLSMNIMLYRMIVGSDVISFGEIDQELVRTVDKMKQVIDDTKDLIFDIDCQVIMNELYVMPYVISEAVSKNLSESVTIEVLKS